MSSSQKQNPSFTAGFVGEPVRHLFCLEGNLCLAIKNKIKSREVNELKTSEKPVANGQLTDCWSSEGY